MHGRFRKKKAKEKKIQLKATMWNFRGTQQETFTQKSQRTFEDTDTEERLRCFPEA